MNNPEKQSRGEDEDEEWPGRFGISGGGENSINETEEQGWETQRANTRTKRVSSIIIK